MYYTYIRYQLFHAIIFIYIASCIYNTNLSTRYSNNILNMWNKHYQLVSTIPHYKIKGDIIYAINSNKKIFIKFLCTKNKDNDYDIRLFNILGLTIVSISVKYNVICIKSNFKYQNNDFICKIQKWLIQTNFFEKQLQKWIVGLPGDNVTYHLNDSGYLSDINYSMSDKSISIFYRLYHINNIPVLPEILDIYYNKNCVRVHINHWSL